MGKKLAEAEARAKQGAAAHEKRVSQLEEELRDARRCEPCALMSAPGLALTLTLSLTMIRRPDQTVHTKDAEAL
jgi:dTDP-4-amino-4,6-dideoxygalactose transaminase